MAFSCIVTPTILLFLLLLMLLLFFFSSFSCVVHCDRDAKGALGMLQSLRDSKTVAPDKLSYTLAIQVRGSAVSVSSPPAAERA